MTVSPRALSVTAAVSDPAPTANLTVTLSASPSQYVFVGSKDPISMVQGIAMVLVSPKGPTSITIPVKFTDPVQLGVGSYLGTLSIGAYYDQALTKPINNSPQSIQLSYTITQAATPSITALTPNFAIAGGGAITIGVAGTHFEYGSVVQWNGSARTTSYQPSGQLNASITGQDLASAGTAKVTVYNPTSGLTSSPVDFSIHPPIFGISSISPSTVSAGGPGFSLTVNGTSFLSSSKVQWNGQARQTTYVSPSRLTAMIPASDIVSPGNASITVLNPQTAGGVSRPFTLHITRPDAVGFQIDPAHSGSIQFGALSLPSSSRWSVTLDGPPSYPIIAEGKVIVTEALPGDSTELVALDQATGAKVWGPIVLGGVGNAVYDSGTVFVLFTTGSQPGSSIQAFNAATGASIWIATLPGQGFLNSAPTAANGTVYAAAGSAGGELFAYDEISGTLKWTCILPSADDCAPAVTPEGVYVSYLDFVSAIKPLDGSFIWQYAPGGSGGGGGTPVAANGLLYAPTGFNSGRIFEVRTGDLLGSYSADMPPAIGPSTGYFLQSGTLRAISLENSSVLWSKTGDGHLNTSPILVNNVVFIGSSTGNVYGFDATSGAQIWVQSLGAPIPDGARWIASLPLSGLGAGDGLLVVPAGNTLTAFALN